MECVEKHGHAALAAHEKMVPTRLPSGMDNFMELSHASLDHVRRCSSRKRAVAGSPSSQPSVNSDPSVVQHDPKGNLTDSGNGFVYTYDSKNRLLSAVSAGMGVNLAMAYDADNKVVSRTLNGTTRYFVYDGWSLIAEYNSTGDLVKSYVHGAGIDEILVQTQGSTDAFYHHDALGSTVLLTNASGNIVRSYEYDVFGQVSTPPSVENMFSADPYANRFLSTGREFLKEANLYDYRNRVYSPDLGRFLQTDPIRFLAGDGNLYRYGGNDLVNGVDPDGLMPLSKLAAKGIVKALRTKTAHQLIAKGKNLFADTRKEAVRSIEKSLPNKKAVFHTRDSTSQKFGPHAQPKPRGGNTSHVFDGSRTNINALRNAAGAVTAAAYLGADSVAA